MNRSIPTDATSTSMENVWLWSPGDQASRWDEFRQAGIAAIGWDDIGDLADLESIAAVRQRLGEAYGGEGSKIDARQCYEFAQVMRPGDWIFAKKGRGEIVGFGIVRSGYMHEPTRDRYKNVRHVEWVRAGSWPTAEERMLAMKTVTRITDNDSLVDELSALLGIEAGQLSSAPRELAPPYTVEDFEEETAIPAETIRLWERRFKRKQHIILQGPPGTGKTFIAERLARLLIGGTAGFCETVQFHPSYSYEDFMQGIRPIVQNEELVFQRMAGRFMRFCEKARHVADGAPCVMIIDEINRGNLSRVFGELMYLLEYRDKTIPLAGEERLFGIPPNVYIIGTMNTADRSIALVDHALRRRFTFIHLGTDYGVLKKQLAKVGIATDGLVATLRALNNAIGNPNYEIGISPFLKDGAQLTETLKDVWEGEIEPYLEEYFYDQPDKTAAFRWKEVSGRIALGAVG